MINTATQTAEAASQVPWTAIAALAVSCLSLWISFLNYRRDRPKLKIIATFYRSDPCDGPPGHLEIKAINIGRRPIYLVQLWGYCKTGSGNGRDLSHDGQGIKLGEHETTTCHLSFLPRGNQLEASGHDGEGDVFDFDRVYLQDSTGARHSVPKAGRLLKYLHKDYRAWCERTGYWKTTPPPTALVPDAPS